MLLSLLSRARVIVLSRPAGAVVAAALPMGAVAAALSLSQATSPRFYPAEPPPPSPYIVAPAEGSVPGACQIGALVVDHDGAARADVPLRLARVTNDGTAEAWQALSDDDGVHRFIDLPAGNYQLTALTSDRAPAAADFTCDGGADRAFVTLALAPAEHVFSGRVTSKDGRAAPGAEIAIGQEQSARTVLAGTARIPVAADGTFSVRLPAGRYVLSATAPNHAPTLRKVVFGDDEKASSIKLALTPAPHVSGRVVDENGDPVAGALVALGGGFDPKERVAAVHTEADGTFSLPVVDGQDVVVTAHAKSGLVARAQLGVVQGILGMSGVEMVAHTGRDVVGFVTKPDGTPWAFGEVRYRVRDLGIVGVEKADADGRFIVAGMPNDADVEVWAEGNATGAWGAQVATPGNDRLALVYTPPAY